MPSDRPKANKDSNPSAPAESQSRGLLRGPASGTKPMAGHERQLERDEALEMLRWAWSRTHTWSGQRDALILEVLLGCGLRASEVCRLQVEDFLEDQILVRAGKCRRLGQVDQVVVPPALRANLAAWATKIQHGPLFPTRSGGEMSRQRIHSIVRRIAEKAGLKRPVSPHCCRHYFLTQLARSSPDPYMVAKLGRLKRLQTVLHYYHTDRKNSEQLVSWLLPSRRRARRPKKAKRGS